MATFRSRPGSPDLDIIAPPARRGQRECNSETVRPVPVSFDPDTGSDLAYVGEPTCTQFGASHSAQCVQTDQMWAFDGDSVFVGFARKGPAR
jgi:hypothetical protein